LERVFLLFLVIQGSLCNDCFKRKSTVYAKFCSSLKDDIHVGDFDGNGKDDLICHNISSGRKEIRFSQKEPFEETQWSHDMGWCKGNDGQILIGDFNGDKRSDMLCHNTNSGLKQYSFATSEGHFAGTSFEKNMFWCYHVTAKVYVGDFNGDGKDDILCHDTNNRVWIANANSAGQIHGNMHHSVLSKCSGVLHVGYFDNDKRADVICINVGTGVKTILTFGLDNKFKLAYDNTNSNNKWCVGSAFTRVADIDGDGLTDVICKTYDTSAPTWVMKNTAPYFFDANSYFTSFCHETSNTNFLIGDFTGDKKHDFLCHDVVGNMQISDSQCT